LGLFLPWFSSGLGACLGLVAAVIGASAWFFAGNPYGIDPTYVAAVIPFIVMLIDHLVRLATGSKEKVAVAAASGNQQD